MTADDAAVLAMPIGEAAESLALGALDWLLGSAQTTEEGLTWVAAVPGTEPDFTLYHGAAGIVLALLEAQQHLGDDRYGDAAMRGAAAIAAAAGQEEDCSACRYPLRPAAPDPARVLGQQRSLLRDGRSPGAGLRPAR